MNGNDRESSQLLRNVQNKWGWSAGQLCSLGHVDIAVCICKTTLTSIGHTGHKLDECSLIITQSPVDRHLTHEDCMLMGWGMNGARMQLEHRFEYGMIATDRA